MLCETPAEPPFTPNCLMGGHENHIRISWLVPGMSTGIQDELLPKRPTTKRPREPWRPRVCESESGRGVFFGLYVVGTLDGMLENRRVHVAPPVGILCSLVYGTVT